MGERSEEILLKILPNGEAKPFDEVLKAFRDYFIPKKNVILVRSLFNSRVQLANESVDSFITALYSLADECHYSTLKKDLIRDRIVIGIRDDKTYERLKSKPDLTLDVAIKEARQAEAQAEEGEPSRSRELNKKKYARSKVVEEWKSDQENCHQCGFAKHAKKMQCPARYSTCRKCRQLGHWDKVCRSKKVHSSTHEAPAPKDIDNTTFHLSSISDSSGQPSSATTFTNHSNIMDVDNVGLRAVATGFGKFGVSFFQMLATNPVKNLVTSPLSVQVLLAMAAYGAGSLTAIQMRNALQLPRDNSLGLSGYHSLIKMMNTEKEVELRMANRIFLASHVAIKPTYEKLTAKRFLSSVKHVDFEESRDAASSINTWCGQQTNNRITKIIEPASLRPDTKFIMVNAVYFKGQWKSPFEQYQTKHRSFQIDAITTKLLPVMKNIDRFRFGDLPELDARFIDMPYKGDKLSMIIILPDTIMGLKIIQDNLHRVNLKESLQRLDTSEPRYVSLEVPKFKIECTFNLQPILEKLGMTSMFKVAADFSGITDTPLNVTQAVQTAFIDVNESGTEAAAVTTLRGGGFSIPFKVDRPFYFTIYHHRTEVSLFSGIVREPAYA